MSSVAALPVTPARSAALTRAHLLGLASVALQVALALLVMRAFRLESRTFFQVALVAAVGFVPHALLPLRWRLPAFVLLSAAALTLAIGPGNALWLLGTGVVLVGLCHVPVRFALRVALLLLAGGALAAARVGWLSAPWSAGAWAVLGSVFMFRLALYLHAVRHEPVRPTAMQAAAYFLMLPNPVFPLFPVVDYTTFVRTHYAGDAVRTYQTGVAWIGRGIVHLLLYRIVYQHLPGDPLELTTLSGLLWHLLGTFLLYLRVSGQFHLIVGMLHLYGFALPETHKLFFLSSSFTDFWRRINIYWKDFMMKLVYYPSFFRLRRRGGTFALVGATVVVFAVTWLLHSYQWFWILGTFPLTIPDALFWGILGGLVIVASLREARRGRDRSLGARRWSPRLARKVVVTFCSLCVLWSLWSAESVVEWVWTWRAAAQVDAAGVVMLVVLLAAGVAIGGRNWTAPRLEAAGPVPWWRRLDVRTAATLGALLLLAQPAVAARLGAAAPLVAAMGSTTINARDAAVEQRGYYERLDHAPRLGAQGWQTRTGRPADWVGLPTTGALRERADFRLHELRPDARVTFLRQPLTTNAWGMRDAPRTLGKPAGTVRIAVFGPSYVFGSGITDDATFAAQLERRLNADPPGGAGVRYEVLNFGVPAHSLLQEYAALRDEALRFAPDVVIVSGNPNLASATASHLTHVVAHGYAIPYPGLDSLVRRWRASRHLPWRELQGLMRVATDDVHAWTFGAIAEESRRRGILPVFLSLDIVRVRSGGELTRRQAADAGLVVLDLSDVYGPADGHAALRIAPWDDHPNAAGNALIAERLAADLRPRLAAIVADGAARDAAAPRPPPPSSRLP